MAVAAAALSLLAACGGGGGGGRSASAESRRPAPRSRRRSGWWASATASPRACSPADCSACAAQPGRRDRRSRVFPTQGNGFWALLWSQANGGANPLNPALSPLPLMNNSIGCILVPAATGAPTAIASRAAARTRPRSPRTALQDAHESEDDAVRRRGARPVTARGARMTGPLPRSGEHHAAVALHRPRRHPNLSAREVAQRRERPFYPILATFGPNVTQLQAAAALTGQITTVWLGSNDLEVRSLRRRVSARRLDAFYNDTRRDQATPSRRVESRGRQSCRRDRRRVLHARARDRHRAIVAQTATQPTRASLGDAASYGAQATAQGCQTGGVLTLSGLLHTLEAVGRQTGDARRGRFRAGRVRRASAGSQRRLQRADRQSGHRDRARRWST